MNTTEKKSKGGDLLRTFWRAGRSARAAAAWSLAPFVGASGWRRRRLLIIAYHGISLEDEHEWNGHLYMAAKVFRRRLQILRNSGCNVLPLSEGMRRLEEGTLPNKSVVLTFDDGFYDFAAVAAPILLEFGFPATNYVNGYYGRFQRPVFDITLSYMLWKAKGKTLVLPKVCPKPLKLEETSQHAVWREIQDFTFREKFSGLQKDELLSEVAAALDIDYGEICRKRLLHCMNEDDLARMRAAGFDIQLHTHRHRVSWKRELFNREVHDNREWIKEAIGASTPRVHFSYPGGVWEPVKQEWLADLGIETATTGIPGLASANSDRFMLPRFIDHALVGENIFKAWLAGSMALLPRREFSPAEGQILEDNIHVETEGIAAAVGARPGVLKSEIQNLG